MIKYNNSRGYSAVRCVPITQYVSFFDNATSNLTMIEELICIKGGEKKQLKSSRCG